MDETVLSNQTVQTEENLSTTTATGQTVNNENVNETNVEEVKGEDYQPLQASDFVFAEGVEADEAAIAEFLPVATELKLDKTGAQKLANLYTKLTSTQLEAQYSKWNELQDQWVESAKSDKEYGGANFDANIAVAKEALKAFATPEFNKMMDSTGVGNNPEFIRFAYRVGKQLKEAGVIGQATAPNVKDPAKLLFPTMA